MATNMEMATNAEMVSDRFSEQNTPERFALVGGIQQRMGLMGRKNNVRFPTNIARITKKVTVEAKSDDEKSWDSSLDADSDVHAANPVF